MNKCAFSFNSHPLILSYSSQQAVMVCAILRWYLIAIVLSNVDGMLV